MRIVIVLIVLGGIIWGATKTYGIIQKMRGPGDGLAVLSAGPSSVQEPEPEPEPERNPEPQPEPQPDPEIEQKRLELEARLAEAEQAIEDARTKAGQREADLEREREQWRKEREKERFQFVPFRFENREVPSPDEIGDILGKSILVDPVTNSVIVRVDEISEIEKVKTVLELLDRLPRQDQYRIEAVIVTAVMAKAEEFSIDWLLKFRSPAPPAPIWRAKASPGQIGISSTYLDLSIERAKSAGRLAVLARPNLILAQGETATISSGREVPVPVSNAQDGNVQTSVEYRRVALELEVSLREVGRDRLALGLRQVNAAVTGTARIGLNEVPEVSSQEWQTEIQPEFGRWYALGGVSSEEIEGFKRKGFFFKNRQEDRKERREIGMLVRVVPIGSEPTPPESASDLLEIARPALRAVPVQK